MDMNLWSPANACAPTSIITTRSSSASIILTKSDIPAPPPTPASLPHLTATYPLMIKCRLHLSHDCCIPTAFTVIPSTAPQLLFGGLVPDPHFPHILVPVCPNFHQVKPLMGFRRGEHRERARHQLWNHVGLFVPSHGCCECCSLCVCNDLISQVGGLCEMVNLVDCAVYIVSHRRGAVLFLWLILQYMYRHALKALLCCSLQVPALPLSCEHVHGLNGKPWAD